MLWLALSFASLPLDVYTRADNAGSALAVADTRHVVIACNRAAGERGVKRGMPVAAASALASDLNVVPRSVAAEEAALERVAAWAIQFTPAVTIARPSEVLLEIEGSLAVFGSVRKLWTEVAEGLRALGLAASIACAPTPLAAQWFARARLPVRLRRIEALRASVAELAVEVMQPAPEALELMQNVGVKTVSDCLALPRDGLARRLGQDFVDSLDRALGVIPDARLFYTPPAVFSASQPLPAPAQAAEMLLFAARRLFVELCGFLEATSQGVQRLTFTLSHHKLAPTKLSLSLVSATRDPDHLTNVLRERLQRATLPDPATVLALQTELLLPLASRNLSFLPDAGEQHEAAAQLIERLRARLGDDAVLGLKRYGDHRPECAWRACAPGTHDEALAASRAITAGRPLWLLARPQRLREAADVPWYDGRLTLLTRPERIESGWWDGNDVRRDYFVASNPREALLWIYRERAHDAGWYLHGFFA
jgi:protein ImuB